MLIRCPHRDTLQVQPGEDRQVLLRISDFGRSSDQFGDDEHETEPMTPQEDVFDSPKGWVAQHIRRYVETDGRKGHRWSGVHTLLLTTRGRRSGKLRRTALIYGRDGDRYLVVASSGGAKKHPSWYLNLAENPEVDVQVGAERFTARAITATAEERPRLWRLMASIWPDYDGYQAKTVRDIPVVVLERLNRPEPPGL